MTVEEIKKGLAERAMMTWERDAFRFLLSELARKDEALKEIVGLEYADVGYPHKLMVKTALAALAPAEKGEAKACGCTPPCGNCCVRCGERPCKCKPVSEAKKDEPGRWSASEWHKDACGYWDAPGALCTEGCKPAAPCLEPDKMKGAEDGFGGEDYPAPEEPKKCCTMTGGMHDYECKSWGEAR